MLSVYYGSTLGKVGLVEWVLNLNKILEKSSFSKMFEQRIEAPD